MADEEDDAPSGSTGIYMGKGSKNNFTFGNLLVGFDNPIVDHGSDNKHVQNRGYRHASDMDKNREEHRKQTAQRKRLWGGWTPPEGKE